MRLTIDRDVKSSRRGRRVARKVSTSVSAYVSRVSLSMVRLHFGNKFIKRKLRSPAFFWEGRGGRGGAGGRPHNKAISWLHWFHRCRIYENTRPLIRTVLGSIQTARRIHLSRLSDGPSRNTNEIRNWQIIHFVLPTHRKQWPPHCSIDTIPATATSS